MNCAVHQIELSVNEIGGNTNLIRLNLTKFAIRKKGYNYRAPTGNAHKFIFSQHHFESAGNELL